MYETIFTRSLFQLYFSPSFVSLQPLSMLSNVRLTSTFMEIGSSLSIPQNANWIVTNVSYLIGFLKASGYLKTSSSNNVIICLLSLLINLLPGQTLFEESSYQFVLGSFIRIRIYTTFLQRVAFFFFWSIFSLVTVFFVILG